MYLYAQLSAHNFIQEQKWDAENKAWSFHDVVSQLCIGTLQFEALDLC